VLQTLIIGIGTWVASNLPWFVTQLGVSNAARPGVVPPSVQIAFAIGAFVFHRQHPGDRVHHHANTHRRTRSSLPPTSETPQRNHSPSCCIQHCAHAGADAAHRRRAVLQLARLLQHVEHGHTRR
jgi:hypothetical protein